MPTWGQGPEVVSVNRVAGIVSKSHPGTGHGLPDGRPCPQRLRSRSGQSPESGQSAALDMPAGPADTAGVTCRQGRARAAIRAVTREHVADEMPDGLVFRSPRVSKATPPYSGGRQASGSRGVVGRSELVKILGRGFCPGQVCPGQGRPCGARLAAAPDSTGIRVVAPLPFEPHVTPRQANPGQNASSTRGSMSIHGTRMKRDPHASGTVERGNGRTQVPAVAEQSVRAMGGGTRRSGAVTTRSRFRR